jgi:hypothetical protein
VMKRGNEKKKAWFVEGEKWLLFHNKAPAYSSILIHDSVTKHETLLVLQPLHSPNLAPANFFLLTKLKSILKGRFESVEDINL